MNPLDISEAEFRTQAARVTSMAGDHYGRLPEVPAYPRVAGPRTREAFDEPPPPSGSERPPESCGTWDSTARPSDDFRSGPASAKIAKRSCRQIPH